MARHDVSQAFDSGIYLQLLLSARHCGLDSLILRVFKHVFSKFHVFVKLPTQIHFIVSKAKIRVWKGIRQDRV